MKKAILFTMALFCSAISFAQSFNYQAVVKDASDNPIANQSIGVQVTLARSGANIFQETHTVTSNANGLITLAVGTGTATLSTFPAIDWSTQDFIMDIAVDITGGTTYTSLGTTVLRQVPYAMYAASSPSSNFFFKNNTLVSNVDINAPAGTLNDDFVFGSFKLDDNGFNSIYNSRLFYDKSKSAFRAGFTFSDAWNEDKIGDYSVGLGEGGIASGSNSFSMGRNANATGAYSIAFGLNAGGFADYARGFGANARGFGQHSTAMGRQLIANSLAEIQLGQYSNFVSGSPDTWVPTDRLFVIGNGQEDINLALNSDALVMLKNGNTTLNGTFTIDGDNQGPGNAFTLPAQDGTVNQIMSTDGAGNVTWVSPAAAAIPNGGNNGEVLSTDGSGALSWVTKDDADADPTNEIELPTQTGEDGKFLRTDGTAVSWQDVPNELPTGGTSGQVLRTDGAGVYSWADQPATPAFSTVNDITSNGNEAYGTNDFIFGAPTNETGLDIDAANRMFFDKNKAAFRVGRDIGLQDAFGNANVGAYSAAFGINPKAAGENSFAAGFIPNASGWNSVAMGNTVNATGTSSVAMGQENTASGSYSAAIGVGLTAETYGQMSVGYLNTDVSGNTNAPVATDRLFVIGNGTSDINGLNKSDALVVLKNGNTTINGELTIDGDNQGMGAAYTLPAQDGNANQIMSTNGSGAVSWIDAPSGGGVTLPTQTGQSGKVLSTDGTSSSWIDTPTEIPSGGTNGQVLSTDGSGVYSWVTDAVNDADSDATNEIELPTGGSNGNVLQTDGSGGYTWVSNDDADNSPTNEIELPVGGSNGQILSTDGSGAYSWVTDAVNDADSDPTNEIELPEQSGQSGKILTTDGTNPSWTDTVEATSVKIPSLPAFNVTSNGTSYTSVGEKEVGDWNSTVNADLFNDGNHLNITNGRFTAPVDGLYFFSAQVRIDGLNGASSTNYSRLMIVKNGDKKAFRNGLHSIRAADVGTASYDTQHVSGILKLTAGDYVSVFVETTGDANFSVQIESGFNGYLVNKM